ncbi:hypothetical protein SRRS_10960 [Sporomusa rhizae]|uniref:hypothetical protein n=1 Tax=Sporomusa rhizae TaxID=357999 RepID=UPI00352A324D
MSEERFNSLEKMLEQLIYMSGHNNAVTEELCQRMDRLESKVSSLEIKLDNRERKVDSGFDGLTGIVHLLGEKIEALPRIEAKIDILNSRLLTQEAEITLLKRAK